MAADVGGLTAADAQLRWHGWHIHERKKGRPPLWRFGRVVLPQSAALLLTGYREVEGRLVPLPEVDPCGGDRPRKKR